MAPRDKEREAALANLLQHIVGIIEEVLDGVELPEGIEIELLAWLDEIRRRTETRQFR